MDRIMWATVDLVRRHWMFWLLLAGGLVLRGIAQVAYEPALLFIDSKKYIFGTDFTNTIWGSFDPLGYSLLILRPILLAGRSLAYAALVQHVLGMAMAGALYALMLRRGVYRWLAALAVPYLGDWPVELGSGLGDYAQRWLDSGVPRITVSEIDPVRLACLRERFADEAGVVVAHPQVEIGLWHDATRNRQRRAANYGRPHAPREAPSSRGA